MSGGTAHDAIGVALIARMPGGKTLGSRGSSGFAICKFSLEGALPFTRQIRFELTPDAEATFPARAIALG